jgi:hypothetical protein
MKNRKSLGLMSALWALFYCSAVWAAGTVPGFSLTPQFDLNGNIAPGCRLYIIQAGTTSTPQNAYQDSALTLLQPNPMTCDAAGRLGQFFVADGTIKLRLTDSNGVQLFVGDNLLVVGASSGGGGGGTVDPTTILATGDVKVAYGTGILSGFVRANGRTIGSATSGATERANADCTALFQFLWNADANLSVSGGRGASAAADWAANKTITLPDARGRTLAGLDDMGNTAAGRLIATYFGTAATVLGAAGGNQSATLFTANLPPYTPAGSVASIFSNGSASFTGSLGLVNGASGSSFPVATNSGGVAIANATVTGTVASTLTGTAQGGTSTPFGLVQPTILATIYVKL